MTVDETPPWCGSCEWNLDAFAPDGGSWFGRRMLRLDRRAGFRADRVLAGLDEKAVGRRVTAGHVVLLAVSLVLGAGVLATAAAGIWLIVTGRLLPPIAAGAALLALAWVLRPRLGSRKEAVAGGWVLDAGHAPALVALVARTAERIGAPMPDVLVVNTEFNASAAVVGWKRTRVLRLGLPVILALTEQQLVAVIGHELGHLAHEDGLRRLLEQPARTVFGALSRIVAPPRGSAEDRGLAGPLPLLFATWQVVGGLVSFVLFSAHVGMFLLAAGQDRRAEVRADLMSVRAAGSRAAMEALDVLVLLPGLTDLLHPRVPAGEAARRWRDLLADVQQRRAGLLPVLRQLSIREDASLLADHPPAGRRRQWVAARAYLDPAVVVTPVEAERLRAELAPLAEQMVQLMRRD
ncbi:M48 family metalloprotease [Actinoplanes sp. NPDC051494]|uniref:M48 family metalloprotease n=1 Tax=Actinoplanes sp. NPDC051494 TaxID=3363907 RepID=UPI0037B0DF84